VIRNLLFIGMAALFSLIVGAQSKTTSQPVVDLPQSMSPIPSPAGKWILVPECGWECSERKLWIENDVSHVRRLVRSYVRTLNVSWAPDGHLFFVNDRYLSNGANCYVFEPTSLKVTDVARLLAVGDPSAFEVSEGRPLLSGGKALGSLAGTTRSPVWAFRRSAGTQIYAVVSDQPQRNCPEAFGEASGRSAIDMGGVVLPRQRAKWGSPRGEGSSAAL
jgi:hypothetical protein